MTFTNVGDVSGKTLVCLLYQYTGKYAVDEEGVI